MLSVLDRVQDARFALHAADERLVEQQMKCVKLISEATQRGINS